MPNGPTFLRNHDQVDLGRLSEGERAEVFTAFGRSRATTTVGQRHGEGYGATGGSVAPDTGSPDAAVAGGNFCGRRALTPQGVGKATAWLRRWKATTASDAPWPERPGSKGTVPARPVSPWAPR